MTKFSGTKTEVATGHCRRLAGWWHKRRWIEWIGTKVDWVSGQHSRSGSHPDMIEPRNTEMELSRVIALDIRHNSDIVFHYSPTKARSRSWTHPRHCKAERSFGIAQASWWNTTFPLYDWATRGCTRNQSWCCFLDLIIKTLEIWHFRAHGSCLKFFRIWNDFVLLYHHPLEA